MARQVEVLAQWINTEIAKNETYHNHKEAMAWTATVAWLYACGFVFLHYPHRAAPSREALSLSYCALSTVVFLFANTQFCMRWAAADRSTALRSAMRELCMDMYPTGRGRTLPMIRLDMDHTGFPQFVGQHLIPGRTIPPITRKWRGVLPSKGPSDDYRWRTEMASYMAIVFGLVAVLLRLWT